MVTMSSSFLSFRLRDTVLTKARRRTTRDGTAAIKMRSYGSLLSIATCSCLSYGTLAFLPHMNTVRLSTSVTFSSRYDSSRGGPHLGYGQRRADQRHVLHASSSSNWFSQASIQRTRMPSLLYYFCLFPAVDFCDSCSSCQSPRCTSLREKEKRFATFVTISCVHRVHLFKQVWNGFCSLLLFVFRFITSCKAFSLLSRQFSGWAMVTGLFSSFR